MPPLRSQYKKIYDTVPLDISTAKKLLAMDPDVIQHLIFIINDKNQSFPLGFVDNRINPPKPGSSFADIKKQLKEAYSKVMLEVNKLEGQLASESAQLKKLVNDPDAYQKTLDSLKVISISLSNSSEKAKMVKPPKVNAYLAAVAKKLESLCCD